MRKLLITLLIFCGVVAQGQPKKPYFNTLNVANGLPEAFVQNSLQDRYGYLWFGTQNGLVRYDGYRLKPYPFPDDEGHEIVNSSARYLFEDKRGKLWVQVRGAGFYFFDRKKDVFIRNKWKKPEQDSLTIKASSVFFWADDKQSQEYWIGIQQFNDTIPFRVLYFNTVQNTLEEFSPRGKGKYYIPAKQTIDLRQDVNGKIWLVAGSLLSYFDSSSKSFKPWFEFPDNQHGDLFETFRTDPADPDILWMNTYDPDIAANPRLAPHTMKIFQFDTRTKKYNTFVPDPARSGALPASGAQIYTDSLKRVWVCTEKGISLFNKQNATFTNYALNFPFAKGASVLASDKNGNLWMGGDGSIGLYYLDTKSAVVTAYHPKGEPGDLPRSVVRDLFFDRSGTLWVNNIFAGISYIDRQKTLFTPSLTNPRPPSLAGNGKSAPFTIVGNNGDSICFISDSSALYAWHSTENKYNKIELGGKNIYKGISKVVTAKDGSFWIVSTDHGLYNYQPQTKSAVNYTSPSRDSLFLTGAINNLVVDQEGIVWIGTRNKGLLSFNKQAGIFTRYPFIINDGTKKAENVLDDVTVLSMFADSEGILWIGTNQGALNRFDTKTGRFTSYLDREKGFTCVLSIYEDKQKRLWVGTYLSGLFLFDRKNGTFKRYGEKDGLLANEAETITEDAGGNIWTFSNRGMSRLNPASNIITNFTEFKIDERSFARFKDAQGNFHFSTRKGFVSFDPLKLNDNKIPPSVIIESISYRSAKSAAVSDTVLFTEGRQEITLAYNENKIGFRFVALHFADASKNQYAYQLTGYDKDWVQAGTEHAVTYTNLSPGSYTFKVKGANSDGVWNETEAVLNIMILPPWWKTWWAYILYAILLAGGIWSYIQYRSKALRNENHMLEQKVNQRTSQLQESLSDLKSTQTQLIQAEKMASLGELTAGIAHEIQNPLNFVNNFSEVNKELVDELHHELKTGNIAEAMAISNDIRDNEEKINYHGKRADAIVKGMLQHSRNSNGEKELSDINALCDEYLRLAYHGLRAKDKEFNATLKTDFDDSIGKINIIPQEIGRVLLNIITNAFYAVAEKKKTGITGYSPVVSISTKKYGNKIIIKIADNGNGIPQNLTEKIFQPFFTTKPTGQGTGLGLSLAYDIVKAHNGELNVESEQKVGTQFIIELPVK